MEELTLKQRLAQKNRKLVKTVELDGDKVDLRRPSHKERLACFKVAEEKGDYKDGKPTSDEAGLRLLARTVATVLYDPQSKLRLYDPADSSDVETILGASWLEDVTNDANEAFRGGLKQEVEEARGNS